MAKRCYYCQKSPVVGNRISHSNIKTKKRHLPNLKAVRARIDGTPQRLYACTRCIRSGFVLKPFFHNFVAAS